MAKLFPCGLESMFKYIVEKEYIHCHRKLMLKNLVFSIDLFRNDIKLGKPDVKRNLIGSTTTFHVLPSQSNFVYHLASRV